MHREHTAVLCLCKGPNITSSAFSLIFTTLAARMHDEEKLANSVQLKLAYGIAGRRVRPLPTWLS